MPLPRWDSIEATGALSNVFFWISIFALVLLGLSEVVQHRYGERHDWLLAQKHQVEKDASDGEIARLQKDTAEANARANEAALALEKFKSPRWLTTAQQTEFVRSLLQLQGVLVDVFLIHAPSTDAAPLANLLVGLLNKAQWNARGVSNLMGGPTGTGVTVALRTGATNKETAAANALISELNREGIAAHMNSALVARSPVEALGAYTGDASDDSRIWVIVGSKP